MVVENAVMRHMTIRHDQAVVSYYGLTLGCRTAVHSSALAENRAVADDGKGLFALKLQVLRNSTHYR